MTTGQKHLIKCRCVLSQFKKHANPPAHQFIVFSKFNDDGSVAVKYAQCNNCGVIHKIVDICRSEIQQGKEQMKSLISIDDIKLSLGQNLSNLLEVNGVDLPTWEAVQHIVENKLWGEIVLLTKDADGDEIHGKYIRILGENFCKVESYTRSSGVV